VSQFLLNAGFGVVIPVLPFYAQSFGLGAMGVGAIVSAPAIARIMLNLPLGKAADIYGRKPLMVGGTALSAVAQFGTGLSTDFASVVALRLLVGVGSAMSMAGSQVLTFLRNLFLLYEHFLLNSLLVYWY
jgi:MFS family permease